MTEWRTEKFWYGTTLILTDVKVLMTIKAPHGTLTLWHPRGKVTERHSTAIRSFMKWQEGRTNVRTRLHKE